MTQAVGVDIGGTKIATGLVSDDGKILSSASEPTPDDATKIPEIVADLVERLVGEEEAAGIGIGAAGFVGEDRSTVRFAPNIDWREEPLGERQVLGEGDLEVRGGGRDGEHREVGVRRDAAGRVGAGEPIGLRAGVGVEQGTRPERLRGLHAHQPGDVPAAVAIAREVTGKPVIVYPNSGEQWDARRRAWTGQSRYCPAQPRQWISAGANILGGCCRVRPADIAQITRTARSIWAER